MRVIVWVAEGTWPACVDAARRCDGGEITLLHVTSDEVAAAARGAFVGLLGRGRHQPDPGTLVESLAASAAAELLDGAERRLGRPAERKQVRGRVEREVVQAAADGDLLICARDGDRSRLGPHSLGPATRFVVDHAPCAVLLVWPERAPGVDSIPPPPVGPPPVGPPSG